MRFASFLVMNGVLLLRPEDLIPEIQGAHLFLISIFICTVLNLDRLMELLRPEALQYRPVATCLVILFATTLISNCLRGRVGEAIEIVAPELTNVLLYYFLMLATVNNERRFRIFVSSLVLITVSVMLIALGNHYKIIFVANIVPCMDAWLDPVTQEVMTLERLVGSGIFNDPNDLCLLISVGILSCIYSFTSKIGGDFLKFFWLVPIPLFVFALLETHSRGGLLGVFTGVSGYLFSRLGGARSIPLALGGCALALLVIGGRQSSITGGGTAHERLMMWCDGLSIWLSQPLYLPTGLGSFWFLEEEGLLAHNSFVQAIVEHGIIGGGAFAGMFYFVARMLLYMGRADAPAWAIQARHYGFAVVAGYAMSCYSLTRTFVLPTYLALGIGSVIIDRSIPNVPPWARVDRRWFVKFFQLSVLLAILIKFATQALAQLGV